MWDWKCWITLISNFSLLSLDWSQKQYVFDTTNISYIIANKKRNAMDAKDICNIYYRSISSPRTMHLIKYHVSLCDIYKLHSIDA